MQQIVPVVLKTVKEILDACSLLCFSHSRVSLVKREGPAVEGVRWHTIQAPAEKGFRV